VRYEWDEKKNRSNQRKHGGISFELASLVFEDINCLVVPDLVDETGEQRWHAIGRAQIEIRSERRPAGSARMSGGPQWRRDRPHHLGPPG